MAVEKGQLKGNEQRWYEEESDASQRSGRRAQDLPQGRHPESQGRGPGQQRDDPHREQIEAGEQRDEPVDEGATTVRRMVY